MQIAGFIERMRDRLHMWSAPKKQDYDGPELAQGVSSPKRSELEALCGKLFEKRTLVESGKIQLLGLSQVKKRIGRKRWPSMQSAIYDICNVSIRSHIGSSDLYIRYNDDNYLLVFAKTSPEESASKVALIAEDIRQRLFEEQGIKDVEILGNIETLTRDSINLDALLQGKVGVESVERPAAAKLRPVLKVVEVEAFTAPKKRSSLFDLGVRPGNAPFRDVHYLPVWDHARKRLIAYFCLAKGPDADHPMEGHWAYYNGVSIAERAKFDAAVLTRVLIWMRDNPQKLGSFGMICPVHYDTVLGGQGAKNYQALCQKIDNDDIKSRLLFMVMDMPSATPWFSLTQMIAPLKPFGRILCAHIPQFEQTDFTALRQAGFDNIGIVLPPLGAGKRINIRSFMTKAARSPTMKTFVLGVDDPFTVSQTIASGVRFLGGQAVHPPVEDPAQILRFSKYVYSQTAAKPVAG
ncbi:MAG: hypothetical protein JWO78_1569 [Micavibrio sp.]|nr:hypothetical protein [Micavibrio sp.]